MLENLIKYDIVWSEFKVQQALNDNYMIPYLKCHTALNAWLLTPLEIILHVYSVLFLY